MTALQRIAGEAGGSLILVMAIVLALGQLFLLLQTARLRRAGGWLALSALHLAAGFVLLTVLLEGVFRMYLPNRSQALIAPAAWLYARPWALCAGTEALSALLLALQLLGNIRWKKQRLTPYAIKEAMDDLPVGVCFGDAAGSVVLANLRMRRAALAATGEALANTRRLWKRLCERGEDQEGHRLTVLEDGRALLFAREELTLEGKAYCQITGTDVTEVYRATEKLQRQNARLRDVQLRMRAFSQEASGLAMEQEILAARVAVHDEMGHVLLRGRYYMEHADNADGAGLLALLRQTNETLLYEAEQPDDAASDPVEEAVRLARSIGVSVRMAGETPPAAAPLLAQAIRECAANAVKHAGGDSVWVRAAREGDRLVFTVASNGRPPAAPITETGGLRSLRLAVEAAGGHMRVESQPAVCLTLTLAESPK